VIVEFVPVAAVLAAAILFARLGRRGDRRAAEVAAA